MSDREHLDWLLEQAAESARRYLESWEKLKTSANPPAAPQ
jgi:hypothetical protein